MPKPQTFHVLRCYQCLVFQVHQAKKSNKFQCKLCGEKQSLKRRYGIGTAKDCRLHVQKLNGLRGELDEFKDALGDISDDDDKIENLKDAINTSDSNGTLKKSKWSNYFEETEQGNEQDPNETMYLNNTEVVLQIPSKRKKRSFNCPTLKESTESSKNVHNNFGELPNEVISKTVLSENISRNTKCKTYCNPNATNANNVVKSEPEIKFSEVSSSMRVTKDNSGKRKLNVISSGFKRFVPPTSINTKSKWAHFVDDDEEPIIDDNEELKTDVENKTADDQQLSIEVLKHQTNSQNLFALCDDNDLDDVLDF